MTTTTTHKYKLQLHINIHNTQTQHIKMYKQYRTYITVYTLKTHTSDNTFLFGLFFLLCHLDRRDFFLNRLLDFSFFKISCHHRKKSLS